MGTVLIIPRGTAMMKEACYILVEQKQGTMKHGDQHTTKHQGDQHTDQVRICCYLLFTVFQVLITIALYNPVQNG